MENRRRGFTLVEVVVSGTVLIILSVCMVQGLLTANLMLSRSRDLNGAQQQLKWEILKGREPAAWDKTSIKAGEYGTWDIVIDTYEMEVKKSGKYVSFYRVRDRNYEE